MIRTEHFLEDAEAWLRTRLAQLRARYPETASHTPECRQAWNRMLCEADLIALTWPREYGGRELPTATLIAFHELCARLHAPQPINSIAHAILAPTLLRFGTPAQKALFLPGIRDGSEIWCQGYSEPRTGSDLSSVRTRAIPEDSGWRISGHKIWTTQAHLAKWCFALVRTEPGSQAHRGLSFMLIDMQAEGVRVEPIRQMTGEADYNEVLFEAVAVPDGRILGEPGEGWRVAMAAAEYERGIYFMPRVVQLEAELAQLTEALAQAPLAQVERAVQARRVSELADLCQVIRWRVDRVLRQVAEGNTPGIDGAMLKLLWSETRQRIWEHRVELLGEAAILGPQADAPHAEAASVLREFLWSRAETIVAGTSEIQRNIVGERVLGLPKDRGQHA
ncbi:acyl-CoA dehydrogenase family protein [Achromobacter deleyi]|uniref:acyl-CoA dehydrogenase family protein n=1 Tax=Achromobacter deleyi TaxID=1353891 RepID=UPI0014920D5E|nr:acyl-CoA dehydrogenase family protein [Achromobacter deleyi]QVQ26369.1 acyl-CoA dehydrogenase family protein [Achromobacter deleyi]UIP21933.1 acyl-CoA dehydrogenase family protein [Achromobacter deleyi]